MTLGTIIRYQFGSGDAIKSVARSQASFVTGIVLVLLTAIPRNYDQKFILESPLWLFGPLLFSLFSGTFLFSVVFLGFIRRRLELRESISTVANWRCFMSLFWMTAPVAWLYALPVERFLDSYHAAEANLGLLAIVSLWRVLLMSRIISVLQDIKFITALLWILLPAALEVLAVVYIGVIFTPRFAKLILAGMSGMINSPEDILVFRTLNNISTGAWIVLATVIVLLLGRQDARNVRPFPDPVKAPIPALPLSILAVVWIAVAIPAQIEQHHFVLHSRLIKEGKYRESVNYLARFNRNDFPASRRIEPDPYEYNVWEELPKIIAVLGPDDPAWIRRLYLDHLRVMFSHRWLSSKPADLVEMFAALQRLPEGTEWVVQNRRELSKLKQAMARYDFGKPDPELDRLVARLTAILEHLGVDYKSLDDAVRQ